ncbi:MAG TPA: OmpA family protein [Bacteroidota bacterium]|nr:OmpA family protein [Bacteroidota bacterium]
MIPGASRRFRAAGGEIRAALCILLAACAASAARAQSDIHAHLFAPAAAAMTRARQANAELLAPRSFDRGTTAFAKAEDLFDRHRPVDAIREELLVASTSFGQAIDAAATAQAQFAPALKARTDALSAGAQRVSADLWAGAEARLRSAGSLLEDGKPADARADAGEAQGMYRSAELEAIRETLVGPARELLDRAEKMQVATTAHQTFERAKQMLDLAEALIRQNRYDLTEARRLAAEAKYEAAHAIYLHEIITQLEERKTSFEDAILLSESAIARIAAALNTHVAFDGGYDPVVAQIIDAVMSRDSARTTLADSLRRLREENAELRLRLAGAGRTGEVTPARVTEDRKADERARVNGAIARAGRFFAPREGRVLRDGNTVVLRLYALEFTPDRNTLGPGSAGVLARVDRAIRLFPDCHVKVEGHTEAGANETLNQKVSEARAAAVADYLRAFPPPAKLIESEGWGSSRPIADNATAEGRAHNRRIDIVIFPDVAAVPRHE